MRCSSNPLEIVPADPLPSSAFLVGERVYLRALMEADADGPYAGWFNDAETCRGNLHHVFPYTREAALDYIRRSAQTREALILAIVLKDGHRHIGNIALQNIHLFHRTAELSLIIGDRAVWGEGFAREAASLLIAHGFNALNLHRIWCCTLVGNEAMQKLAARLGMRKEGRRREAFFKAGAYHDVIDYGLLRGESKSLGKTPRATN